MSESVSNEKQTSDEEKMIKYYRNYINNNQQNFDVYNVTSIGHIFILMSGLYGDEPQQLAIKLMKKFINWYKENKPDNYFPDQGCKQMYPISALEGSIMIVEDYVNIKPEDKLKLINNLIIESKKSVPQVSLNEYMKNNKQMEGKKMINLCAVAGGAALGWLASHLFLK